MYGLNERQVVRVPTPDNQPIQPGHNVFNSDQHDFAVAILARAYGIEERNASPTFLFDSLKEILADGCFANATLLQCVYETDNVWRNSSPIAAAEDIVAVQHGGN
jgi:hypothetical protein